MVYLLLFIYALLCSFNVLWQCRIDQMNHKSFPVFCKMHNLNFIVILSLLWIIKWFVPPLITFSAYFYYDLLTTSGPVSWRTFIDTLEVCLYYHPQPFIFFQVCFSFPGCDCQWCFLLRFSVKLCSSMYRGI